MFELFRHYICSWNFVEALHFWIEIGQLATLVLLLVLVIKLWKRDKENRASNNRNH